MSRTSYDCNKCGENKFPGFVMSNAGRLVLECAVCQYIDTSLGPADFNRGVAALPVDGAPSAEGWSGKRAVVVETTVAPSITTTQAMPLSKPADVPAHGTVSLPTSGPWHIGERGHYAPPAPIQPGNIIGMMEDRALWLGSEEARLEGERAGIDCQLASVRAESRKLTKMLRAGRKLVADDSAAIAQPQLALVRS